MKRTRPITLLALLASAFALTGCASSSTSISDGPIACAGFVAQCACTLFAGRSAGQSSSCGPHAEAFPAGTNAVFLPSQGGCR